MLVAFIAFLMVASAFAGLAMPVHIASHNTAKASEASGTAGRMNLLTDLGSNSTLLLGDVGVNLPGAIPTQYTHSPPLELSPIMVSPSSTVAVGTPVLLSVQASDGLPPYTYSWSFGNGQTGSGNAVTISYQLPGTYTVIVTASDAAFQSASETTNITVVPNLQVSLSPSSQSGVTGSPVMWSYLITGGQLNYSVSVQFGDGASQSFLVNATNGLQAGTLSHSYTFPGNYMVLMQVTDALGDVATATAQVNITYAPLSISLTPVGTPMSGQNDVFNLTITGGTGTNQVNINWGDNSPPELLPLVGDGSTFISHFYLNPGQYIIQFNATDTAGAFASGMISIKVIEGPLGSMLFLGNNTSATSYTAPLSVAIGHQIVLNATIFGGAAPYRWILLDNNAVAAFGTSAKAVQAPGFTVFSYTINKPGINVFQLLVQDSNGNLNFSNEVIVNVIPQTLEITNIPSPTHGYAPLDVAFNVSLYNVEFGSNGEAIVNISVNFTNANGGVVLKESGIFTFSGAPGTFANEYNILNDATYPFAEAGNYSTQFDANYSGNSTIVNSNIVIIHVLTPPGLSVSISASPTMGSAPLNTSWTTDVSGGIANYYYVTIDFGSNFAQLEAGSVQSGVRILVNTPGLAQLEAPALLSASGVPYFDFSYNIVYGLEGTFTAVTTVQAYNNTFGFVATFTYDVTIVVQRPSPLFLQLYASQTTVGVGMPVFFYTTINGGGAPYSVLFSPNNVAAFFLTYPAAVKDAPVNFQTEPLNVSGTLMYNYWNYTQPGVYTAFIAVEAPSDIGILFFGHYVAAIYFLTINVIGLSASIQQNPSSNLVAPVDIAFSAVTSGGLAPFTYQWALSINGSTAVNVSTAQSFVMPFDQGSYTMFLTVTDSLGNVVAKKDTFSVSAPSTIAEVVSARLQAELTPVMGGPTYFAYSGPALWGEDGSINATFMMPNVPATNAQYYLNVSYGYTVAITELSGGSWQTYFFDVYSPQPYASSILTVVSGGQILSSSQLQNGLNGINSNLSADTMMLSVMINGVDHNISVSTQALKQLIGSANTSINSGILAIKTQGSTIMASLASINASVMSVSSSVSNLGGSLSSDYATLSTDIGNVQASFASLNATVVLLTGDVKSLQGAQVQIDTSVGSLSGDITNVSNGVATIQTTAGQIKVATSSIQGTANNIKSSMSTLELMLVVVIVLALISIAMGAFSISRSNALARKLNGKGKGGNGGTPPAGGSTMMVAVQPYKPRRVLYRRLK